MSTDSTFEFLSNLSESQKSGLDYVPGLLVVFIVVLCLAFETTVLHLDEKLTESALYASIQLIPYFMLSSYSYFEENIKPMWLEVFTLFWYVVLLLIASQTPVKSEKPLRILSTVSILLFTCFRWVMIKTNDHGFIHQYAISVSVMFLAVALGCGIPARSWGKDPIIGIYIAVIVSLVAILVLDKVEKADLQNSVKKIATGICVIIIFLECFLCLEVIVALARFREFDAMTGTVGQRISFKQYARDFSYSPILAAYGYDQPVQKSKSKLEMTWKASTKAADAYTTTVRGLEVRPTLTHLYKYGGLKLEDVDLTVAQRDAVQHFFRHALHPRGEPKDEQSALANVWSKVYDNGDMTTEEEKNIYNLGWFWFHVVAYGILVSMNVVNYWGWLDYPASTQKLMESQSVITAWRVVMFIIHVFVLGITASELSNTNRKYGVIIGDCLLLLLSLGGILCSGIISYTDPEGLVKFLADNGVKFLADNGVRSFSKPSSIKA